MNSSSNSEKETKEQRLKITDLERQNLRLKAEIEEKKNGKQITDEKLTKQLEELKQTVESKDKQIETLKNEFQKVHFLFIYYLLNRGNFN